MSNFYFIISELCYCYIVCKGMRMFSGVRRTKYWVEVLSYIGYGIVISILYQLWNIPALTLITNIVGVFILSFNYEGRLMNRIFHTFVIYILLVIGETLAMVLTDQTAMNVVGENQVELDMALTILARLFQLMLMLFVEKIIKNKEQRSFSILQLLAFVLFISGSIYLEIVLFIQLSKNQSELLLITNLVILILNILVIWIYDTLGNQYQKIEKVKMIQMRSAAYENELALMREREDVVRTLRHDMRNHCLVMKEQLKQEEIEKVQHYLDKVVQKFDVEGSWIQTGNQEIDSFVNYKFSEAQKRNIHCEAEARIPENLNMDEFSIASIMGNLLDNAITAAEDAIEPSVKLALTYVKQNLQIIIVNTYRGKLCYKNGKLVTKKPNKLFHGYGLESVKREVKKCNGSFQIEHNEEVFSVQIMLPVENTIEKKDV